MKNLLFRVAILVAAVMFALGARAQEAYACYTSENTTLTFYYDTQRSSRTGTTYDMNIPNNDPRWYTDGVNANVTKVVFDPSFEGARPTSTYVWFYNMRNLESIEGIGYLNTSEVTDMDWMFFNCIKLTSLDLRSFNTAKLINMSYLFYGCSALKTLDLSSFNTSRVTNMIGTFFRCGELRTIFAGDGWTTAAVTKSDMMFYECFCLVGGKGTPYDATFVNKTYARIDGGVSNPGYFTAEGEQPWFDTEPYACYTPENTTLTFYCDTLRTYRTGMTYYLNTDSYQPEWESDSTNANVTKVVFDPSFEGARPTTTYHWFDDMRNLESIEGMSYLNTSEVTDMGMMFGNCKKLTSVDVSNFNTVKALSMYYMFMGCSSLTSLDLSSFNTSSVYNMIGMFYYCNNLRTIYVGNGWSTASVTDSRHMFENCFRLVGGQGTTYNVSNPMDKTYARIDGGVTNPGYFTAEGEQPWLINEAYACYTPENTTLTFYYDGYRISRTGTTYDLNRGNSLTAWYIDSTNANVTQVVFDPSFADARPTSTYYWFNGMERLQAITGMNYLNTSEVTEMSLMFSSCGQLTSLDLSSFNTSNVTRMIRMFFDCNHLRTIYVSNGWSTTSVIDSDYMFASCSRLVGGQGTTFSTSNPKDKTYAHIDGGPSNPGYFTEKPIFKRGDVNNDDSINIGDVTALIDYLLSDDASGINLAAADCNLDNVVSIGDVTALIDYLLSGVWK